MKKIILIISILLLSLPVMTVQAQNEPLPKSFKQETKKKEKKRPELMTGGSLGLQFGTYTSVSLSPVIGIYPTDWLLVGTGLTYMYTKDNHYNQSLNVFGISPFIQGLLLDKRLMLYAGYEYVSYSFQYEDMWGEKYKEWRDTHALFLGPGYRQRLSDNMAVYGMLLFDVLNSPNSIYSNPLIRFGFIFDF
ncbi:hypothetical protein LJC68_04495 [Bacteroidales bacterium OttesenSCG-928-B11]|nr:hypothetical protein [Bacteroidales bacterium OttesenSCG-928-B11]